jgi:transposase
MSRPRRSFSPEYRVEAAHRVIDGNRRVAEVARELNLNDNVLHKWVRDERRRMAAAGSNGVMTLSESAQSCSVKLLTGDGCLS